MIKKFFSKLMSIALSAMIITGIFSTKTYATTKEPIFTVMTYNVFSEKSNMNNYFLPEEKKASTRAKMDITMINTYKPDIFATTEETDTFTEYFDKYLTQYDRVGDKIFYATPLQKLFSDNSVNDRNTIWYNKNKFGFLGTDTIWLYNGDVNNVGKLPGETNYRATTLVALRFRQTGEKLVISNAHLGLTRPISKAQADIMIKETEKFAAKYGIKNIVYTGDYNRHTFEMDQFKARGFNSVWDKNVKSHNKNDYSNSIDHIYTTPNVVIRESMVLDTQYWSNAIKASDHRPVMATLHFNTYAGGTSPIDSGIKTTIQHDMLRIETANLPQITNSRDPVFASFFDNNGKWLITVQLIVKTSGNTKYIRDSIKLPSNAKILEIFVSTSSGRKIIDKHNIR